MSGRVSIAFQTDKPLTAYGALAQQVERYGFDGVSVYNDMLYQPAWLPLLEIAKATRRVRIGPAAVNPFTCHPITIAGQIAQIDEASQGRAYLGLARGGWLDFVGLEPAKPVSALREAFASIAHLLQGNIDPLPGEFFSLAGGDTMRWPMYRRQIPFLLGSWGAKTIGACIEFIDEVKIGGSANPDLLSYFHQIVTDAAASRDCQADIGLVLGAVSVVDMDGRAARELARREVALYVPIVAGLDSTLRIDPDLLIRLKAAAECYDFEAAGSLISDELLRKFAFAGTPEDVADQVNEALARGAARVELGTPHGLDEEEGLRLLGEYVLPAISM
ncbi:MAG: LLM class flavin-dependent oxidoreductase [Caldilineaceae bacterium]